MRLAQEEGMALRLARNIKGRPQGGLIDSQEAESEEGGHTAHLSGKWMGRGLVGMMITIRL